MQKKHQYRLVAMILAAVFAFEAMPLGAMATGGSGGVDLAAAYENGELAAPTVIGEVEELRTEEEKQFQMSDGSYMAVSYGMPVHYQDENGQWADIDNTLQPVSTYSEAGTYSAVNGESAVSFAADLANGQLFATSYGAHSVSLSLALPETGLVAEAETTEPVPQEAGDAVEAAETESPETTPATAGDMAEEPDGSTDAGGTEPENPPAEMLAVSTTPYNTAVQAQLVAPEPVTLAAQESTWEAILPDTLNSAVLYENVFSGVDLLYNVSGYHIKESIIVKAPQTQYRFSFRLNLEGLTPALEEDGSVTLSDSEGAVVYLIPAPYLFDAANHASDAAAYSLSGSAGEGYILTVEADAAWMNAADRAYPVTIDPTLLLYAGHAEGEIYATFVEQGNPNADHGHYQDLYFGYTAYQNAKERQIYMHFNELPTLPMGSVVVNASLNLWQFDYTHVGCSEMGIGVYPVTGSKPSQYANYHDWLYYMDWNTKPAYDSSNMIDYTVASKAVDDSYLSWELTELVNQWYEEGTENRTIALVGTESGSYSSTYCAVPVFYAYGRNHPPVLTVSYRNNTGIEPYYTYQTMGAGHAGTAYISDFSNQLTVAKELFTLASTTNPFSVQLVFNSAYFSKRTDTQYDLCKDLGMDMHVGSGCTYNFIQHVKEEVIDGTTYLRYLDGDGTIHYFRKDAELDQKVKEETNAATLVEYYHSEDGLNLKINEYAPGYYSMTDDQGNEWVFVHGPLLWIKDDDGNRIEIHYSKNGVSSANQYPTGSGDRIEEIVQYNAGTSSVTLATFQYKNHTPYTTEVSNYLSTITDYAGNVYAFDYQHGKLTSIDYNGEEIAQYTMRVGSTGWYQNQMDAMTDVEAGYTLKFSYTNHRISAVEEVADGEAGAKIEITKTDSRSTTYRDLGADRISGTSDDILTHYGFDYAGRTVNAYTTDAAGNILGASNAAYTGTGSTDRTNNRTLRTASIGVAAQQELRNFGFESTATDVAWTMKGGTASVAGDKPRTGAKGLKTWLGNNQTGLVGASKASNQLQANTTYIFSAYVNTSQAQSFAGDGVYLQVTDTAGNTWKSPSVNYKTSPLVDDGWVRLVLVFQTKVKCNHTVAIYNDGVGGTVYADDAQVEWARAPVSAAELPDTQAVSNVNLLENGSLQYWKHAWNLGTGASFVTGMGVNSTDAYANSIRINGSPKGQNGNAWQVVQLNQPSSQTYVLSGWAKANAVPDNVQENSDQALDQNKQFGLRALITYADGGTEGHYAPFDPALSGWQFTSLTIVPKRANATVSSIQVLCAYEKNANTAWFDDLSLVREAAQTMRYDEEGNLESAATTGIKAETDTYENGNLIKSVTGGYGTYTYTYDSTHEHRLTAVTNDVVTQTMGYDQSGNVKSTQLKSNTSSYTKTLNTSATYTAGNNLVSSVKDATGQTESYTYGNRQSIMTGQPTAVKDANGKTTAIGYNDYSRVSQKTFANGGKLLYNYTDGLLSGVTRVDATGKSMAIAYLQDSFGNLTGIEVGGILLASYEYAAKNGNLLEQTYGNGDTVSFTYDNLGRVVESTYSSGRVLRYTYTGDGQVYSITDNNGTGSTGDDLVYRYTYDTLGRVIHCQAQRGIQVLLETHWEYDEYSRVKSQGWQMGTASYKETFAYSEEDGSLVSITTQGGGATLSMSYDPLQRLSTVSNGIYSRNYTYRDLDSTQTTSQASKVQYYGLSGLLNGLSYNYTYDTLGHIASIAQGNNTADTYAYDSMGQLTSAWLVGEDLNYTYTYDTAGNLLKVQANGAYHDWNDYTNTYTYGNNSWKDLLTKFNNQAIAYEGQTYSPSTGGVSGTPVSGNPISYFNGTRWAMDWAEGRNLVEAETSTETTDTGLSFAYDASGLRTEKTVVTKTYETVHTHDYTATVIQPTCTEGGYTLHECDCGDSYQDNETDPLGHDYEKISQDGYYTYYRCTRCDVRHREPLITIPITTEPPLEQYGSSEEENQVAATPESNSSERQLLSTVTEEHSYIYAGGMLLRETITSGSTTKTLDFRYDNVGHPYALIYNNGSSTATYYYITNLQGDVMYLVDSNGNQVAAYTYDPYGKILSAYGSMAEINPLRYRGYYYDAETGFYYLQSRYYDPNTCRFINADSYASTGQSYLGYNMFAYCGNNPVERTDADGEFWDLIFDVVSVVTSVVEVIKNPDDPWAWAGLVGDIVDVAVPFVGGVGEVTKAVGAVSKTADLVDSAYDATKSIDNASDAIKYAQKASDAKDTAKKLHRPYIRKSTRDAVEAMAPRAADGRFLDANTGKVIDGKYDLGHKYGHEFRRERERAQNLGWTQKQFNNYMNNPVFYQIEDPRINRSHKFEMK